ncbi:MAG: DNA/RNA nuclease SfsA [Oscillospiraceae bacterium]|nr:DNA/RNA nuclease SfsA [Oscillospiraceae bacterium]
MTYGNITRGKFLSRPNRFIAQAEIDGRVETVHVKNTGRCRELLIPGCDIWLTAPGTPGRKTKYDLVAVRKSNGLIINIDSQAPNKAMHEWLKRQGYEKIIPEYTYGSSRIDFCLEKNGKRILMEVKGCTLERDGTGYFPDAPTERGIKHIHELIRAKGDGYGAVLAFVIQMNGINEVRPNTETHPGFGQAWNEAVAAGVEILFLTCDVWENGFEITGQVNAYD